MPFAALHFLAGVEAARAAGLGGLDRLAVDHPGTRAGLAAGRLAHRHQQEVVDRLPASVVTPSIEVALHRAAGRELLRQHAPLATGLRDVEDCVDHVPQ